MWQRCRAISWRTGTDAPVAVPGCHVGNAVASQEGSWEPTHERKLCPVLPNIGNASLPPFPFRSQLLFVQQMFVGDLQQLRRALAETRGWGGSLWVPHVKGQAAAKGGVRS